MKILFVCPSLAYGGAERVCVSWANGLIRLGHSVDILLPNNAPIIYKPSPKVQIVHLPVLQSVFLKHIPIVNDIVRLRKLILKNKYQIIVEVLHYLYFPIRLATWSIKRKIPIVYTTHTALERPLNVRLPLKSRIVHFYTNRLYDYITVLTNRDKEILNSKKFNNVTVLHNPLFLAPTQPISAKKQKIILSVGRVDRWYYKGFDLLIQAWNKVYPKHTDWKLNIVGNASEATLSYLQSLVENKDSIEFIPFTENIKKLYEEAAIYCLSSRYEGWGLVLVEAMSQGCAAIACDFIGRQAEIIDDGKNGLLCTPGSFNSLADKLETLLSDEMLITKFQEEAPKSLEKFQEDIIARKLETLLKQLI
ncbi:MAG: glycosyltransferase family 4 protein [Bacteroides sp.]|nr:glycosyltransferase family 4 protein [Bacteroides sp.]MBD5307444.1 glycosyltransferase family 4 protein [Bacteroides sp.]